jgi:two-component system, repressor protein LuxO
VEDDASSRNALLLLLRHSGFDGRHAATVSEAIAKLPEGPCCVILDLMLPDGNGSSVLEHIRTANLPMRVAIATGASDWEQMVDAPRLRPDAVFRKPLQFDRLMTWLNDCTTPPGRTGGAAAGAGQLPS